jgi:hypothetical protein
VLTFFWDIATSCNNFYLQVTYCRGFLLVGMLQQIAIAIFSKKEKT